MKRIFALIACVLGFAATTQAQTNVGINTANPVASAALMVDTAATGPQGMLVPRMTQARRNAITSPATGLMVYQTDNTPGFYYYNGTGWSAVGGNSGARLDAIIKKTAATQLLPVSTTSTPELVVYDNVVTTPTIGSYSTATNAYTVGASAGGLYLIQARNSMVDNSANVNNTLGAYLYLEVNGAAYGSFDNIYPTYVSNGSLRGTTSAAIKSATSYMFMAYLNAGDVIKIRGYSLNSSTAQTLNNDGGTQVMIVKL